MAWVFLNQSFLPEDKAFIPITDRGFLFGDGVFTTIRVCQGRVEFFQAHLQRLYEQCLQLNIEPPAIEESWILKLIRYNEAFEGVWRLKILITGGEHPTLHLPHRSNGQLLITLKPYSISPFTPCQLCVFSNPISKLLTIKSLSCLDQLFINQYAHTRGYEEALIVSNEGFILETAFSNIFWFDGQAIWIPDIDLPYLQGIFLNEVIKRLPLPIQFFKRSPQEIPLEAAFYTCNTLAHVRPVVKIEESVFKRQPNFERFLKEQIEHKLSKFSLDLSPL